jgi:hypothetical protein
VGKAHPSGRHADEFRAVECLGDAQLPPMELKGVAEIPHQEVELANMPAHRSAQRTAVCLMPGKMSLLLPLFSFPVHLPSMTPSTISIDTHR